MAQRRGTIAQHGLLRTPGPMRQLVRVLGVALTVAFVSGAGVAAYAAWDFSSAWSEDAVVLDGQESAPPDIGALDDEGVNILFAGLDACEEETKHLFPGRCDPRVTYDETTRASALNDVNLVMHISPEPRRVTVISFPRDLMLSAPECSLPEGGTAPAVDRIQLNELYQRGDIPCVANALSALSGLQIDYAASITWGGVIEITNAIGGVEVCVGGKGIYDEKNTGLALAPGQHTLVGQQALEFLRTRQGVGDGSDLGRIGNQQVYMTALVRTLMSDAVLRDAGRVLSLARTTLESVRPSSSLTDPVKLAQIGMAAADVPLSDFTFVQYPVVDDLYNSNRVAPDEASAEALWVALAQNVPLEITGDTGGGAVLAEGEEAPAPEGTQDPGETPASGAPSAAPTPAPAGTPASGELGANVRGSDASQVTCSNGRGVL
ncbi:LCP family protein [Microbacterium sp. JZ70]